MAIRGEKMRSWLKTKRNNKGLTQSVVAKMAGIDVTMVSKIELGERNPSVEVAKKIAAALDFDWVRFYQDDEQAASKEVV